MIPYLVSRYDYGSEHFGLLLSLGSIIRRIEDGKNFSITHAYGGI